MDDVETLFKEYFAQVLPETKTKYKLILFMLAISGYKKVGDFGIACKHIYRSNAGKFIVIKNPQ